MYVYFFPSFFLAGAATRGGKRGDVPPLAFKEGEGGEEEEDGFGPVGPKNMKKMDINWFFLPIFEIQKPFESSF